MATSHQIEVAAGNEEQYAAWNGDEGERWVAHPEFFDASVSGIGSTGGAAQVGAVTADHPVVSGWEAI